MEKTGHKIVTLNWAIKAILRDKAEVGDEIRISETNGLLRRLYLFP